MLILVLETAQFYHNLPCFHIFFNLLKKQCLEHHTEEKYFFDEHISYLTFWLVFTFHLVHMNLRLVWWEEGNKPEQIHTNSIKTFQAHCWWNHILESVQIMRLQILLFGQAWASEYTGLYLGLSDKPNVVLLNFASLCFFLSSPTILSKVVSFHSKTTSLSSIQIYSMCNIHPPQKFFQMLWVV